MIRISTTPRGRAVPTRELHCTLQGLQRAVWSYLLDGCTVELAGPAGADVRTEDIDSLIDVERLAVRSIANVNSECKGPSVLADA